MRRAVRAKAIIESAVLAPCPLSPSQKDLGLGTLDNIDDLEPLHEEIFDIGPVSNIEEPKPLNEDELEEIRVFKHKLTAYKKSFPGKFSNLNWSAFDGKNIEEIEDLYNKAMLTLNHDYQKSAGMVGVAYQTTMSGLEGVAKMTGGLVLLNGLSVAMAKNKEIRDILTQINIETMAKLLKLYHQQLLVTTSLNILNVPTNVTCEGYKGVLHHGLGAT